MAIFNIIANQEAEFQRLVMEVAIPAELLF